MTKSYLFAGVEVVGAVVGIAEGTALGVAVGAVTLRIRLFDRSAMYTLPKSNK